MDLAQFLRCMHETYTYVNQFCPKKADFADLDWKNSYRMRYTDFVDPRSVYWFSVVGANNDLANNSTRWNPFVLIVRGTEALHMCLLIELFSANAVDPFSSTRLRKLGKARQARNSSSKYWAPGGHQLITSPGNGLC
jgi:hypothetical protein